MGYLGNGFPSVEGRVKTARGVIFSFKIKIFICSLAFSLEVPIQHTTVTDDVANIIFCKK